MIWETLFLILYMFLIAIVIVHFDYMSSIVSLILLNLCNCSYSIHPEISWTNDWQYVDMVFRYLAYLQVHPDIPCRVVVRVGDSYVDSSAVHPPYVGRAERGREGGDPCVLISSLDDAPLHLIMM
jgi:hypothetical protein